MIYVCCASELSAWTQKLPKHVLVCGDMFDMHEPDAEDLVREGCPLVPITHVDFPIEYDQSTAEKLAVVYEGYQELLGQVK